jgi:Flp pilus assembly protein TadB
MRKFILIGVFMVYEKIVRANQIDRLSSLHSIRNDQKNINLDSSLQKLLKDIELQKKLEPRLLLAGYISQTEQDQIKINSLFSIVCFTTLVASISAILWGLVGGFMGVVGGLYVSSVIFLLWISYRKKESIRSIYYELPLVLEELVLLIESGLSLFPAMEEICCSKKMKKNKKQNSLVRKTLQSAYQLASYGMPMSQAFEQVARVCPFPVLRHVMLHLDISSSVGGELLHSIQSLSQQVHREWKLAVETRIKRLENLVIFPVFISVMGLMLLTAAVPLVPVIEYMSTMKDKGSMGPSPTTLVNKRVKYPKEDAFGRMR